MRKALIAALGLSFALTAPGPASAAPPQRERVLHEVTTEFEEGFCDDLNVRIDTVFSGSLVVVGHGPDGFKYLVEKFRGSFSVTNLDTDRTYRSEFAGVQKDLSITDNGDGTLTIEVLATGAEKWYANDRLVLRATGQVRFEILIDHAGTPTDPSDDVFIDFLGFTKGSTGTNDTDGRDFCEDVHLFTT